VVELRGKRVATITERLASLAMSEDAQRFADNRIDAVSILRDLTEQDLKDIGVPVGHRRKMLRAIAEVGAAPTQMQSAAAPEPKPRDDAERRQLTVMFTDLVGSTALSAKLDSEDLRFVIGAYRKCVAQAIARFDGFVANTWAMALFRLSACPRRRRRVRSSGRAGARRARLNCDRRGRGRRSRRVREAQERGIVGETPNLARLQDVAEPNILSSPR
jgi:class 3 adenylate cyclase